MLVFWRSMLRLFTRIRMTGSCWVCCWFWASTTVCAEVVVGVSVSATGPRVARRPCGEAIALLPKTIGSERPLRGAGRHERPDDWSKERAPVRGGRQGRRDHRLEHRPGRAGAGCGRERRAHPVHRPVPDPDRRDEAVLSVCRAPADPADGERGRRAHAGEQGEDGRLRRILGLVGRRELQRAEEQRRRGGPGRRHQRALRARRHGRHRADAQGAGIEPRRDLRRRVRHARRSAADRGGGPGTASRFITRTASSTPTSSASAARAPRA